MYIYIPQSTKNVVSLSINCEISSGSNLAKTFVSAIEKSQQDTENT
jgi:hypothetical protein